MKTRSAHRSFAQLARDTAGNTLAIMTASIIPLVGMVGGAVDMSRLYLVKSRLQQACDAGTLAARRTMTDATLDDDARTQATNFFNANFREGAYGATDVDFAVTDVMNGTNATGQVAGTADAAVPLSIMHMFGFEPVELETTCEAELNVTNNDVVFVLDTTGSMACLPSDSTATCKAYTDVPTNRARNANGIWQFTEREGSRIDGLRDAVENFFRVLDAATSDEARLRIGFVPYSANVNVAGILPANSMVVGTRFYDSRVARTIKLWRPSATTWEPFQEQNESGIDWANCQSYQKNQAYQKNNKTVTPNPLGEVSVSDLGALIPSDTKPNNVRYNDYEPVTTKSYNGTGDCKRKYRQANTTTSFTDSNLWGFRDWTYKRVQYTLNGNDSLELVEDLDANARFSSAGPFDMQTLARMRRAGTATGVTAVTRTTDGCISERLDGMDDINAVAGTEPGSRWAPSWPWLTYNRQRVAEITSTVNVQRATIESTGNQYVCPRAAQRLAEMTQTEVDAYVNSDAFVPDGGTYHDIGMIWGARFLSTTGAFSADHAAPLNGRPVNRHIIFMTDGDLAPGTSTHSPYGMEVMARRRQPTGSLTNDTLKVQHSAAFLAACAAARNAANTTVWVVAFGQTLTADMITCAGDSTRDFESNDAGTLNEQFEAIAKRIAELRLSE